jgi:hypothetical protein
MTVSNTCAALSGRCAPCSQTSRLATQDENGEELAIHWLSCSPEWMLLQEEDDHERTAKVRPRVL